MTPRLPTPEPPRRPDDADAAYPGPAIQRLTGLLGAPGWSVSAFVPITPQQKIGQRGKWLRPAQRFEVNYMYARTSSQAARGCRQVLIALLAVTMAAVQLASAAQAAPDNQAAVTAALAKVQYNEAHPILAYYYAWWETAKLTSGPYQAVSLPFTGARDISDDDSLLRTHIAEARSAGIDGWIVNRASDVARLLDVARGSDFRVTLQVDSDSGPEAQLQTFYQHANDPGIVTYAGQPVVIFRRAW